ncbi:MAG: DUF916 domain-containing protein [Clostridia bacterium]|nr:DUF916 domain-containing protein [Clostridia bacterium]
MSKLKLGFCIAVVILTFMQLAYKSYGLDESKAGLISIQAIGENVRSGYFDIRSNPGDKGSISLRLINSSDKYPANGIIFVSDAVVAVGGGMGSVNPKSISKKGVGGWFDISQIPVALKPKEVKDVNLHFTIPKNASSGDHVGEVVAYQFLPSGKTPKKLDNNTSEIIINKAYSQAIGILINIPGPYFKSMSLKSFKPHWTGAKLFLNLEIANEGNKIEKSTGKITISEDNMIVHEQVCVMDSVYPGTSGIYSFQVPDKLKETGNFSVDVEWNYGVNKIQKSFDYKISDNEIKDAEVIEIAEGGKKLPKHIIILTPTEIIVIILSSILIIVLLITIGLVIRRKYKKNKNT